MANITICGAPFSGKGSLLTELALRFSGESHNVKWLPDEDGDRIWQTEFRVNNKTLCFTTSSGSTRNNSETWSCLISKADLILYILSASPMELSINRDFWFSFSTLAEKSNKHWDHIPWVLIVNKTDIKKSTNNIELFSKDLKETLIPSILFRGYIKGVNEIVDRVISLI